MKAESELEKKRGAKRKEAAGASGKSLDKSDGITNFVYERPKKEENFVVENKPKAKQQENFVVEKKKPEEEVNYVVTKPPVNPKPPLPPKAPGAKTSGSSGEEGAKKISGDKVKSLHYA